MASSAIPLSCCAQSNSSFTTRASAWLRNCSSCALACPSPGISTPSMATRHLATSFARMLSGIRILILRFLPSPANSTMSRSQSSRSRDVRLRIRYVWPLISRSSVGGVGMAVCSTESQAGISCLLIVSLQNSVQSGWEGRSLCSCPPPLRIDLPEGIHAGQRDGHLGLHNIAAGDFLRLVGSYDTLERPTPVGRQLDAIVLRGAVPEVLLQVDVALVRVVEVESYDDLAGVDKPRQFLAHIAGRVQLVDFRDFALGLRRLDAGNLGNLFPGRAVVRTIELGPQASGLGHLNP